MENKESNGNGNKVADNLTELVFVLDCSGSMQRLVQDTIGGFNAMIERQRSEPGACVVSTVLFDDYQKVVHNRLPLEWIPPMDERTYTIGGCTALLDAVGRAIRHTVRVHRSLPANRRPANTVFVITTDGCENASREFMYEAVDMAVLCKRRNPKGMLHECGDWRSEADSYFESRR